ncbi:MAG: flagellar type III secretion system protein FlhB [Betaproteobacteria bacterium]|nr:flagellar type III secretion system protein FlhB [Betaproteobacteria bacterium]
MAEDSDLERTEPASQRKLDKAREQGQVPRSRDLTTFAVLLASGSALMGLGLYIYHGLGKMMRSSLSFDHLVVANPSSMGRVLFDAGLEGLLVVAPLAAAALVAVVVSNLLVSGWVFSPEAFMPKLSKLSPVAGLGRMFSWRSLAELVKAILTGLLIAGAAGWMIWHQSEDILALGLEPLSSALVHLSGIVFATFMAAASAYALVVAIDVFFQIWNYHHGLRMTKEEVRQESKEMEGDPQIKARIRALQREAARRRMMQEVPKADVVVTNPRHYAVALRYEEKGMSAPRVVAKGSQLVAQRIRELAAEGRVPVVEAPPLARALFQHVEVGDAIPGPLFSAVAQLLAYVYQLGESRYPVLPSDWLVPEDMDPGVPEGAR